MDLDQFDIDMARLGCGYMVSFFSVLFLPFNIVYYSTIILRSSAASTEFSSGWFHFHGDRYRIFVNQTTFSIGKSESVSVDTTEMHVTIAVDLIGLFSILGFADEAIPKVREYILFLRALF